MNLKRLIKLHYVCHSYLTQNEKQNLKKQSEKRHMAQTAGRRHRGRRNHRRQICCWKQCKTEDSGDKSFTTEEEIMSVQNVSLNDVSFKIKINRDRRAPLTQGTGPISEEGEMPGEDRTALFMQPQQLLLPAQD